MSLHWIYVLEIQISDRKCMFEQKLSAKNEPKESIEWKLLPETSRTKSSTHSSKIGEGGSVPQSFSYDFNSGSWFVALWGGATVPETTTPKNESRISGHQTTENEMAKEEDWWLCHGFGSDAFCMLTFWTRTKFSIEALSALICTVPVDLLETGRSAGVGRSKNSPRLRGGLVRNWNGTDLLEETRPCLRFLWWFEMYLHFQTIHFH